MVHRLSSDSAGAFGPIARIFAAIAGVLILAGSLFIGLFVFLGVAIVAAVGWGIFRLRLAWLRGQGRDPVAEFNQRLRKAAQRQSAAARGADHQQKKTGNVIDGDYRVVSRDSD